MSQTPLRPPAASNRLAVLVDLLERRSRGDQWLFEARGAAHQLASEVAKEGNPRLEPVCFAIRDLFGHLLRHGLQEGDEVLPAVGLLVQFVGDTLNGGVASNSGARRGTLQLGSQGRSSGLPPAPNAEPLHPGMSSLRLRASLTATGLHEATRIDGPEAWRMVNETRLGEILVREGRIDGKTLDQALVLQQVGCKRLGEVLVGMGKLAPDVLSEALDHQRELTLKLADGMTLQSGMRLGPAATVHGDKT